MSQNYPQPPGQPPHYSGPGGYPPPYYQAPPPPQVGSAPLAPYRLGNVFTAAWHNIVKNPGAALGMPALLMLIGYGLMMLIIVGIIWVDASNNFPIFSGLADDSLSETDFREQFQVFLWIIFLITVVAMVPMIIFSLLAQAVTVPITARDLMGLRTRFGQSFRLIKPVLGKLIMLGVLYSIAAVVLMFAMFASLVFIFNTAFDGANYPSGSEEYVTTAILQFVGIIFAWVFIVMAVAFLSLFLLVRLVFVTASVVIEGLGPFAALRRSWTLITGRYWPVLGTFLLFSLIVSTAAQIVSMVFSVPTAMLETRQEQLHVENPEFFGMIAILVVLYGLQLALTTFLTVYQSAAMNNVYYDLRFRKEGLHLALADAAFNDPVLQAAAAKEPNAVERTKDYLPGELRSAHVAVPGGAGGTR